MAVYWDADAVVFDAFHTLIAAPSLAYAIPVSLRLQERLPNITPARVTAALEPHFDDLNCGHGDDYTIWCMALDELGLKNPPSDLVYELLRLQAVGTLQYCKPRPYMREVLEELRERGIATAVCSNAGRTGRFVEQLFDLPDLVDAFVVSCDIGVAKPDEKIFLATADALGLAPQNCLYVDDGVLYLEKAQELGFHPVHAIIGEVSDHFPEALKWQTIRSLPEILELVRPLA